VGLKMIFIFLSENYENIFVFYWNTVKSKASDTVSCGTLISSDFVKSSDFHDVSILE